jgi:ketosteroid isomerase-like protein
MSDKDVELSDQAFALFSGSEQDRKDIITNLNAAELRKIWSNHPSCVFFNGTGYNYYGIDDWLKLWEYYRPRVKIVEPWQSSDVRLIGDGRMAVVTSIRNASGQWTGEGQPPDWTLKRWRSRCTEVFSKDGGQWKCVHIHISTEPEGQRHEQRAA